MADLHERRELPALVAVWARAVLSEGEAMMVVAVKTTGSFAAESPNVLFTGKYVGSILRNSRNFDISPDGRRFVMIKEAGQTLEASARDELMVVLNWFEELRKLVPTDK